MSRQAALGLVHGLNRIVRPLDRRLFAPRRAGVTRDPVFIVGPARSGTTLLFQALAHVTRTSYLPQLLDYGYGASNLAFRLLSRKLERHEARFDSSYGRTHGWLGPSEAFGFWRQWFWKGPHGDHRHAAPLPGPAAADLRRAALEISSHGGSPLLVKCLYLSLSIPALASAFPDARFVYVRRDAVANAASALQARRGTAPGAWWSTRPEGFAAHLQESAEDQVLWQLAALGRTIPADLAGLPTDRAMHVRYEDFCRDPAAVTAAICARFELAAWPENGLPASFPVRHAGSPAASALASSRYFTAAVDALR